MIKCMSPGLIKEGIEKKEAVVVETGEEFGCNTCDKTYRSKNRLRNHIQFCHGIAKERITKVCHTVCHTVWKNIFELEIHQAP